MSANKVKELSPAEAKDVIKQLFLDWTEEDKAELRRELDELEDDDNE
jgi:hypothetical protein